MAICPISIPERLAGRQGMRNARLRLRIQRKRDEMLSLKIQQPLFVDQRTALDLSTAQGVSNARGDFHVVLGNETAFEHVDEIGFERGCCDVARRNDLPIRQWRTPT